MFYNKQMEVIEITFSTIEEDWIPWQLPFWKAPHDPCGEPKLANLIDEIWLPSGHWRWTLGLPVFSSCTLLVIVFFQYLTGEGCSSEMKPQTLVTFLLTNLIWVGSLPLSSNITSKLSVGFNQDLGTWYL